MESANLYHLQDQLVNFSSLSTPSYYGAAPGHSWILNNNTSYSSNHLYETINEDINNSSREYPRQKDSETPIVHLPSHPILGLHWTSDVNAESLHSLQFGKIKDEFELPSNPFPKFTEMIINGSSSMEDLHHPQTMYMKNGQKDLFSARELSSNPHSNFLPSRGSYSQIFPSVNISHLNNRAASEVSSSLDMGLQAMDLLNSAKFRGNISQPSDKNLGPLKESLSFGQQHNQQPIHMPANNPFKVSPIINGATEVKRSSANNVKATKVSQTASKKSRLESRACPPFKVRKEKLGDRVAALQQLVAPFGKTDTASVLMEAIGYIKFLQNQVETLSVPYMKSSRNRITRSKQAGQVMEEDGHNEGVTNRELRSRGLCLLPLSCMSYVTDGGSATGYGGGLWPPS